MRPQQSCASLLGSLLWEYCNGTTKTCINLSCAGLVGSKSSGGVCGTDSVFSVFHGGVSKAVGEMPSDLVKGLSQN